LEDETQPNPTFIKSMRKNLNVRINIRLSVESLRGSLTDGLLDYYKHLSRYAHVRQLNCPDF